MTESNERVEVIWTAEDEARLDEALARRAAKRRAAAPQAQPSDWKVDLNRLREAKQQGYDEGYAAATENLTASAPQAQPAPAGQPFVPLSMPELLRRVERARQFPVNTCPASRNVHLMACALAIRQPYAMLTDEPQHCAESMLYVLASLWEARTEIERLARSPEPAPISDSRIIEIRDSLLPSQGESFDCIAFARVVLAERMAPK